MHGVCKRDVKVEEMKRNYDELINWRRESSEGGGGGREERGAMMVD